MKQLSFSRLTLFQVNDGQWSIMLHFEQVLRLCFFLFYLKINDSRFVLCSSCSVGAYSTSASLDSALGNKHSINSLQVLFCGLGQGLWPCPRGVHPVPIYPKLQVLYVCNFGTKSTSVSCQECPLSPILFVILTERRLRWVSNLEPQNCISAFKTTNIVMFVVFNMKQGWFSAESEVTGIRISRSVSESVVICWKSVDCSLWVGSELLPLAQMFMYLGVLGSCSRVAGKN